MISGCGVDVEELNRFKKHLCNFSVSPFVNLVLSKEEIENFLLFSPDICLPIAFCCKEAMFKALGESSPEYPVDWKDIQIFFADYPQLKKYKITLSGIAKHIYSNLKRPHIQSNYYLFDDYIVFEVILYND